MYLCRAFLGLLDDHLTISTWIYTNMTGFHIHIEPFFLLPSIFAFFACIWVKLQDKKFFDIPILAVCLFVQILNAAITARLTIGEFVPSLMWDVNSITACFIIPLAYIYICRCSGAKWRGKITFFMWAVIIFALLPHIDVNLDTGDLIFNRTGEHSITFFRNGEKVYFILTGNFVILIQTLLTLIRIPAATYQTKQYNVRLSKQAKTLLAWWGLAFVFIMVVVLLPVHTIQKPFFKWTYFGLYSIQSFGFFYMIARRFDTNVLVSEEKDTVKIEEYVNEFEDLARRMHVLLEEKEYYLDPNASIEDAAERLSTNRTYITQMMHIHFHTTFADQIVSMRVMTAKELLLNTDLNIKQVAERSGFKSDSSLCRVFHREVGVSPNAWRLAKRDETDAPAE